MTQLYLNVSRGAQAGEGTTVVAIGTSVSGDVSLTWLSTNNPTKQDLLLAIKVIEQYIIGNGMPGLQTNISTPTNDLPVL